jgi:hypothetical protein
VAGEKDVVGLATTAGALSFTLSDPVGAKNVATLAAF